MFKLLAAAALSMFSMTACTSLETSLKAADISPTRLILKTKRDGARSASITVIRDRSISGSTCLYSIYINDKLAARVGVSEKAVFWLEPGEIKLQATRDPSGQGLCSLGDDESTKRFALERGEKKLVRLSTNMSGSPSFQIFDAHSSSAQ